LAPSGAGLLILKLFWRQKARVVLRLKISGMKHGLRTKKFNSVGHRIDHFRFSELL
jgi:hypothetical protein